MPELKKFQELPVGGTVVWDQTVQPKTGGWRTGLKPTVNLSKCVNCLLCWVNCPDTAVLADNTTFKGFDYDYCKGCQLCAEVCPTNAIEMVDEAETVPAFGRIGGKKYGSND